MTYRRLLTLLDQEALCASRVQVAIRLAKSFDAELTGLAPTGLVDMPGAAAAAASLAEFAELAWIALRDEADGAATEFRRTCTASRFSAFEALVETADQAQALLHHAHCHDLVVLSQADPDQPGHARTRQIVEQSVLFSARPTLLLPYAGSFEVPYQTVMVAWDDSREAARAIADALPLLRQAARIHVVTWKENGLLAATDRPAPLEALRKWLFSQGVQAEMHSESTSIRIADAMLSRVSDLGADLLVMGAYGHARWAERVLGGATRGLLASMTVPVLMSH